MTLHRPEAMNAWNDIAVNTTPVSVAITKRLLYEFLTEDDRGAAAARQGRLFSWTGRQPDAREGVMAFLEKHDPQWKLSKTGDLPSELRDGEGVGS